MEQRIRRLLANCWPQTAFRKDVGMYHWFSSISRMLLLISCYSIAPSLYIPITPAFQLLIVLDYVSQVSMQPHGYTTSKD